MRFQWVCIGCLLAAGCDSSQSSGTSDGNMADVGPGDNGASGASSGDDASSGGSGADGWQPDGPSVDAGPDGSMGQPLSAPPQVPAGWKLAFDDEFEGSTLDPSKWQLGTGEGNFSYQGTEYWDTWIPAESEYATASMVAVQNSNLIMTARAAGAITGPTQGTKNYISGYVTTGYGSSLFAFQYGYIEFRAKLPAVTGPSTGLWPALWLYDSTYSSQDEIDVVESFGGDQTSLNMTVHNAAMNASGNSNQDSYRVTNLSADYHVFGALKQHGSIAFYVDDHLQVTYSVSLPAKQAINMGLQLGNASKITWMPGPNPSQWGGGIHGPNTADLSVDWVRVWTP